MSSPSRRSNDYSAIRGSGRSPNSVGRSSSQPPQPYQHPTAISGTHGGTANSASWPNRPPSNVQGTAPGQAPAAALYASHTQPSLGNWDYMLDVPLVDSAQQQITVPELYPTTFPTTTTTTASSSSRAQYESLQGRDRLQQPTTTSSRAQYENPQSRDRQSTTWPGVSHPSHVSVQPASQPPQDVLYTTQPLYRQTQDSQNLPSQRRQQQPSSLPHRPLNNQDLDSNRITPPSQPVVPPNTLNTSHVGTPYNSQYNPPSSTAQHTRIPSSDYDIGHLPAAQRPPPSPNRQEMSSRPTRPGEGEGMPDRWVLNSAGALSGSAPIVPRPGIPHLVAPNIVPPQDTSPVPRQLSVPTCIIPGCREQVVKDLRTDELTEYCGKAHMSEALRRGVRVCPACNQFPRRTGSEYCGTGCKQWAAKQREEQQQQQQRLLQQQRQGQHLPQQQHGHQRQGGQQPSPPPQHQRQGQQPQQHHQRQGQQQLQQPQQPQQQRHQQQPSAPPYPPSVTWTHVAGGPTSSNTSPPDRQGQFNWTNVGGGSTSSNTPPQGRQGQYNW